MRNPRLKKTLTIAVLISLFDGLFMGQGVISGIVCFWMIVIAVPRACFTQDRSEKAFRLKRAAIYVASACIVFAWVAGNNTLAELRADKLITAIKAYHAKYHQYPEKLDQLAPEFISHVPLAKYVGMGQFFYSSKGSGDLTGLFYIEFPNRYRIYNFKTEHWSHLD